MFFFLCLHHLLGFLHYLHYCKNGLKKKKKEWAEFTEDPSDWEFFLDFKNNL